MARGRALVEDVLPILEADLVAERDARSAERFQAMCERYAPAIERERQRLRHTAGADGGNDGAAIG